MLYLKRKHRIQFQTEKVWFVPKKFEKIKFLFVCQNFSDMMSSIANFSNLGKEIQKLSCSVLHIGW